MNLVIENEGPQDFPEKLTSILKHHFKESREIWYYFGEAFWPENKKETFSRFMKLPEGSNIICEHTFVDFEQMELIVLLLLEFKKASKRINLYIYNPSLIENLVEYLSKDTSDVDPGGLDYERSKAFKDVMNESLFEAIEYHCVYQMKRPCMYAEGLSEGLVQITKSILVKV